MIKINNIDELREEFYERIIVLENQQVIRKDDVVALLEVMRNITLDWVVANVKTRVEQYYTFDPDKDFDEYTYVDEQSILDGKINKNLKF